MPPLSALAGLPLLDPRTSGSGSRSSVPVGWLPTISSSSILATSSLPTPRIGSNLSASLAGDNVLNLLPVAASRDPLPTAGVYVGEGLPPIPPKLATKILRWDFVQMAEMLPEFWPSSKLDDDDPKRPPPRRPRQVTDIFLWIQCYCSYVSVLASRFGDAVPELMAYMVTITRVSKDYSGLAWVRYDSAFRRQAAITKNRKWSQINPSLYSMLYWMCTVSETM